MSRPVGPIMRAKSRYLQLEQLRKELQWEWSHAPRKMNGEPNFDPTWLMEVSRAVQAEMDRVRKLIGPWRRRGITDRGIYRTWRRLIL